MVGEHAIAELLAKQDIYECIMRYSRGTDRHDRELMLSAYHPDAIDDHGVERTVEDFVDNIVMRNDLDTTWVHHIGNMLIELFGDVALVETYWVAYRAWTDEEGNRFIRARGGRYADRFECRSGEWKVAHRRVIDDWSNVQRVEQVIQDPSVHFAAPYPDDPIYVMRREILAELERR